VPVRRKEGGKHAAPQSARWQAYRATGHYRNRELREVVGRLAAAVRRPRRRVLQAAGGGAVVVCASGEGVRLRAKG